jgi:hypothetical protein
MVYRGYLKLFGDYKKSPKNKFDVKYKFKDYTNDFNMKFSDIAPQKKMKINIIEIQFLKNQNK